VGNQNSLANLRIVVKNVEVYVDRGIQLSGTLDDVFIKVHSRSVAAIAINDARNYGIVLKAQLYQNRPTRLEPLKHRFHMLF